MSITRVEKKLTIHGKQTNLKKLQ